MKKIKEFIKKRTLFYKLLFPIRQLQIFLSYPYKLIKYNSVDPREYFIFKKQKLVYLVNSKVAQTAIVNTCGNIEKKEYQGIDDKSLGEKKQNLTEEDSTYYSFTFVRNPFERLYSCYQSKYIADKKRYGKIMLDFDYYMLGLIKKDRGFEYFVKIVSKIPDWASDRHFKSQYSLIHKESVRVPDFIGRYENLEKEFEPIRVKYNLEKLTHLNKSSQNQTGWRESYTPELIEIVYKRYKKDFDEWYPNAKIILAKYLAVKLFLRVTM